ncbi:DUF2213 domain-containing protein [Alicyclobacillus macrosporangiidus]|uniref:DUF2213 domain-containing protein n=1 Tax=Alicyclobacillus macrosporangiidus TaxID=392015 RepID=A0A1I7IDH0_9BACL|nr:DUF2213 domain-containing protein [Alicyclobacillus macrosporangiidus]SFU70974.1 hypothetical protein SAMN05421543_106153 [Alicyclobacillus macrosporangiidus]
MKAFYGSRFSPNQTMTPEGFLVAHNVPISRAGWYEYLASEIGADTTSGDRIVKVFRDPAEVFSPAAMASFEGKPLTDGHPPAGVTPDNASWYAKGAVQNVRRGTGEDNDLLLADLVVYDERLINEIRAGKREVSAGYECEYVPNGDGTYSQRNIVGNHVAVVESGRAGDRVRIRDQSPDDDAEAAAKRYGIAVKKDGHRSPPKGYPEDREDYADPVNYKYPLTGQHVQAAVEYYNHPGEREKGGYTPEELVVIGRRMVQRLGSGYELRDGRIITPRENKQKGADSRMKLKLPTRRHSRVTDVLAAIGLKQFAVDAEPDEIVDAVDAMAEERASAQEEPPKSNDEGGAPEDVKRIEALEQKVDALTEMLRKLVESKTSDAEKSPEEAIDEAIAQMEDPENTPPRTQDNAEEEESHTIDPSMVEDEAGPVAPPEERPQSGLTAVDTAYKIAALKAIKPIIAAIPDPVAKKKAADAAIAAIKGKPSTNTYAMIERANRQRARDQQTNKPTAQQTPDISQLGREWAKKYNPHYKERA